MLMFSQNQSSCQPRLGPDAGENPPGGTVGESRMFQGEGTPSRTPLASSHGFQPSGAFAAPQQAPFHCAPHDSASRPAPRASSRQALHGGVTVTYSVCVSGSGIDYSRVTSVSFSYSVFYIMPAVFVAVG